MLLFRRNLPNEKNLGEDLSTQIYPKTVLQKGPQQESVELSIIAVQSVSSFQKQRPVFNIHVYVIKPVG